MGIPDNTKAYPELIVLFGKVRVTPYGTPSTDEIHEGIEDYIIEHT